MRVVRAVAIGSLLLLGGCARVPGGTFLVPPSAGAPLTDQCSRASIKADWFWKATPQQAVELDGKLHALLAEPANHQVAQVLGSISRYHRQIVGFTRNEQRFLYANFYTVPAYPGIHALITGTEHTTMISVCDGGPEYWGATLNVQTGAVESIDTNGSMGESACHWSFTAGRHPETNATCGCVFVGPNLKRPLQPLPKGLRYCPVK